MKSSITQSMCMIRCMTILHYSPKHNTLFISNSLSLSLGRRSTTDNPLRMSTEVIRDSITVVHLAEEFTAKHDLTVLSVEVCDLCLNLVSCLSASCHRIFTAQRADIRKFFMRPWIGHAAASPRAQMVCPSICLLPISIARTRTTTGGW